jgi:hypothetical protein
MTPGPLSRNLKRAPEQEPTKRLGSGVSSTSVPVNMMQVLSRCSLSGSGYRYLLSARAGRCSAHTQLSNSSESAVVGATAEAGRLGSKGAEPP